MDTTRTVETPEGVTLALRVAGLPVRAGAWGVDMAVRGAAYSAAAIPLSALGDAGSGVLLIAAFLLEWFYPVLFEVWGGGSTPGKRMFGLVVVHDDGSPVRLSASVVRNLLRAGDFLPVGFVAGAVSMVVHPDCKRLGDLAAGTLVLHRVRADAVPALAPGPVSPPPQPLRPEEQQAVAEYAARAGRWSEERQEELAALLAPLTGATGREGVRRLFAIARWVRGGA